MSNLTNTFIGLIEQGVKSMNAISDPKDKGLVAAELAKAVAATGLIGIMTTAEDVEMTATEAEETKEAIAAKKPGKVNKPNVVKPKPNKAEEVPAKEDPGPDEVEPEEIIDATEAAGEPDSPEEETAEWTDEAIEKYGADLEYINQVREEYGDEGIEASISDWSEGVYKSFDDISPLNVKGFATYLEMLVAELAENAE